MYALKFLKYIADSEFCSLIVGTDDILRDSRPTSVCHDSFIRVIASLCKKRKRDSWSILTVSSQRNIYLF